MPTRIIHEPGASNIMSVINQLKLRQAVSGDIAAIVGLLSDDPLGAKRENPDA